MKKYGYNTNLAAEYYVLSVLYRKGVNAYLTLGNRKAIDIVVDFGDHVTTIDVKGIAGTTLWPLDNFAGAKQNHYLILLSFLNKIHDANILPEAYIVPSDKIEEFMYHNPKHTRKGIRLGHIRAKGIEFRDAWSLIK
jgi:hypothetical protein